MPRPRSCATTRPERRTARQIRQARTGHERWPRIPRFASDPPLEGDGFEPSVPGTKERFLLRKANCGTERGQPKKVASYAVPMVRIHLHPALIRSPRRRGRGSATAIDGTSPRKSSSHRTPRWRGLDSNFPFRAQMGFGLRLPDVTGVPRAVASAAMPGHHDRICLIRRWRETASNSRFLSRELPTLSFLQDRRRGSQSVYDCARS
jgi:hypothetical protein